MIRRAWILASALVCVAQPSTALDWPGRAEALVERFEGARDAGRRAEAVSDLAEVELTAAIDVLRAALTDGASEVRAAACNSVAAVGAVELEPLLIERLGDRAAEVQIAAARALGELRTHSATQPLARLLADPSAEVRVAAVRALARLGNPQSVVAVSGVLSDSSRDVVVAAVETLGSLGQPGTVYAVLEKATDPSEEVAVAAIAALVELRSEAASGVMIELMSSGRPAVALASIEGLGHLGAEDGVPALVAEVISPSVEGGREAALGALVAISSPDAIGPLTPMLLTNPSAVSDYFTSVGVAGWDAFRNLAERVPIGQSLSEATHHAWLRSGDPRAVADVSPDLEPEHRAALLRESPTAEAVCAAVELGGEAVGDLESLASWAAEAGAVNCLRDVLRDAMLSTSDAVAIATSLAPAEPALALRLVEEHVALDELGWEDAAPLVASAASLGRDGVPLLESIAFADDFRVRQDAVAALLDVADSIPPRLDAAMADSTARRPEWVHLVGIETAVDPDRVVRRAGALLSSRNPAIRAAAVSAVSRGCLGREVAASALTDDSYWVRRAAYEFGLRCGGISVEDVRVDPVARRLLLDSMTTDALVALVRDETESTYLRVAAIALIRSRGERERASEFRRSRSSLVAAASWLTASSELGADELAMRAIAAQRSAERAAMFEVGHATMPEATRLHALRRESSAAVERVLNRGETYHAGVVVYAVDRRTGYPRQDEDVFVIRGDGSFDIHRSGASGLVVLPDPDIRAVFVGE